MNLPGGTKTIMMLLGVAGGAAAAAFADAKRPEGIMGQPTGLALGAALLAGSLVAGSEYGKLMATIAAGALAKPLAGKALELLGQPSISGTPYIVGQLPEGASMQRLPAGYAPVSAAQLYASAGLA